MRKEEIKLKEVTRNKIAYLMISFSLGISSLADLAIQYFFKDVLLLQPYEMSTVFAFIMIPWIIKPALGLLTDLVPIFGYRRKIYLLFCGFLCMFSLVYLGLYASGFYSVVMLLFMVNLSYSFASIIGEAIVVELSAEDTPQMDKAKDYVSLFFLLKNFGGLISAFFRGYLVQIMTLRNVFLLCSAVPLLLIFSGLVLFEHDYDSSHDMIILHAQVTQKNIDYYSMDTTLDCKTEKLLSVNRVRVSINKEELVSEFFRFIQKKRAYVPAFVAVILFSAPTFFDPFFYYMTNFLKFTPMQLGVLSFVTSLGIIIAILIYRQFFKNVKFVKLVTTSTFLYFIVSFLAYLLVLRINLTIGISDFVFCNLGFLFLTIFAELSMLPILTLACSICPKKLEATVYSFFMSSINLGVTLGNLNSSLLTYLFGVTAENFDNLGSLIIVTNLFKLVPIVIITNIKDKYFNTDKKENEELKKLSPLKLS